MKHLTAQYPPVACYLDPDRQRYLPQYLKPEPFRLRSSKNTVGQSQQVSLSQRVAVSTSPPSKMEDHALSVVLDCISNVFSSKLRT